MLAISHKTRAWRHPVWLFRKNILWAAFASIAMLPDWLVIVEENWGYRPKMVKKGQWKPFCCLLPSPAVTDFSLFVWQLHLFYQLSPRPVTNRWPVPHSKVICFAQQQLWVTPAKLHLVFQYYNPSQRQRQWKNAEKRAGGREGRKKTTSSDQINATVSTSDKSCLGSSLLRAWKASTASSPQLCLRARWVG